MRQELQQNNEDKMDIKTITMSKKKKDIKMHSKTSTLKEPTRLAKIFPPKNWRIIRKGVTINHLVQILNTNNPKAPQTNMVEEVSSSSDQERAQKFLMNSEEDYQVTIQPSRLVAKKTPSISLVITTIKIHIITRSIITSKNYKKNHQIKK